jgi:outer membrane protein
MRKTQQGLAIVAAWSCLASQLSAQSPQQVVEPPHAPILIRSYEGARLAPLEIKNSDRLRSLTRAGKLYLTVQDAIAVAIENNLDLEVDRYGPLGAEWNLKRQQAGGPLKGVTGGNTLSNQATSGQGVVGSEVAAGLATNSGGNTGTGTGGVVQQIGPITPNLDPVFQNATSFQHITTPQPNATVSQVDTLVDSRHIINSFVQQGLITGGYVQVAANESYLKENAPTNNLNPGVAPVIQITARHSLLQGFGLAVNRRFITIAEKQIGASRETFRSQLLNLVASVLNLYWDLVADNDDLKVRLRALEAAQKFQEDTKRQVELGAVARVELLRPSADYSARRQEVEISQATVRQQENLLKTAISKNGLEDPLIDAVEIVPLDHVEVPDEDNLPGLRTLLARALAKRPDITLAKISDETGEIQALGTINTLLPTLQGIYATWDAGQAGVPVLGNPPDPKFVGGLGTALGQVFRRDYYSQRLGASFNLPLYNRQAQGDYGIDQLQLRQGDLIERRNMNAILVAISNQMVALRQAHSRYSQAVDTRALQEQLLEKEQQMFNFGGATITDLVAARTTLLAAQLTEVEALAAYGRARVALDQTLGETLEVNHVSIEEALNGRVSNESKLPATTEPRP